MKINTKSGIKNVEVYVENDIVKNVNMRAFMVFYNNTMLPETDGNGSVTWSDPNYPVVSGPDAQDYFFSSDAIDIQVSSTQIDPKYEGTHAYS